MDRHGYPITVLDSEWKDGAFHVSIRQIDPRDKLPETAEDYQRCMDVTAKMMKTLCKTGEGYGYRKQEHRWAVSGVPLTSNTWYTCDTCGLKAYRG